MSAIGRARLAYLARKVLPYVKQEAFDMASWGYKHECGTHACAAGYMALSPRGMLDKFRLSPSTERGGIGYITYGNSSGIYAVTEYFDMELQDADAIFTAEQYWGGELDYHHVTPSEVASMIECYLASGI